MTQKSHGLHVLGIESSCDDTGVAILRQDGTVMSNCIHSQLKQHLAHGGIIPMVAKEYHVVNIDRIATLALTKSGLKSVAQDIDAIAVTNRPGMNSSLQVGLNYARTLAKKYCKPLIPVHHMQAHALMPLLQSRAVKFPFLVLLMSGGHCLLAICERYSKFHLLGHSIDDAPGDILDKIARRAKLINLGPPFDGISGGAAIELLSQRPNADRFKYFNSEHAVPLLGRRDCDFSFSGYKGASETIMPEIDKLWLSGDREKLLDELGHLCGSLQRAMLVQIFKKLHRALYYYRMYWRYEHSETFARGKQTHLGFGIRRVDSEEFDWPDVVVSGGVAANRYMIEELKSACSVIDPSINVFSPPRALCSDNGLMIAWNGLLKYYDYITSQEQLDTQNADLNERIIISAQKMELVETMADCPIGSDVRGKVKQANFVLTNTDHPEFKIGPYSKRIPAGPDT